MISEENPAILYAFVYEFFDNKEGWEPGYSLISGQHIGEAFANLGRVIQELSMSIRNIHYGLSSQMQDEIHEIEDYSRKRDNK